MLNNVVLMGRIAADLELKTTPAGVSVMTFPIAVEKNFANSDGKRDSNFFQVVAWRGNAEFISKFFKKGDTIAIMGELSSRDWTDKEGKKRREIEVVASAAYFTAPKSTSSEERATPRAPKEVAKRAAEAELPFAADSGDSDPWA